jgi:FKBP-type peptidyl-prolyl cis-trans isomerase
MRVSAVALFAFFLSACGSSGDARRTAGAASGDFAVDSAALTKTASGLRYQDVAVGKGAEAQQGQVAVVHYTGWLTDGTKFDSSRDRGEPFSFPIGAGQVIPGWDEGVAGMKVGGRRKLVIPADLGYGDAGAPPVIPPGATLVFDVELMDVQ